MAKAGAAQLYEVDYIQNVPEVFRGAKQQLRHVALSVRSGAIALNIAGEQVVAEAGSVLCLSAGLSYTSLMGSDGQVHYVLCSWTGAFIAEQAYVQLPDHGGRLQQILHWLWQDYPPDDRQGRAHCRRFFDLFLAEGRRQLKKPTLVRDSLVQQVRHYLQREFHRAVSISELARTVRWSREHLIRRFKAEYGMTPNKYLQVLRVEKAIALARSTTLDDSAIARKVGIASRSHLAHLIRRETGKTLSQLRES